MAINPVTHYQQVLSMALEDRSRGYQDLVSNNNAFSAVLNRKGMWRPYSGPRIRQTLQIDKADLQWYSGYDFLDNPPIELFNDAYFTPKMAVVPITLTMEEILNNEGEAQILDTMEEYIDAAERALADGWDAALFSDGSANGGKEIGGLDAAIPILDDQGVYGGISRVDHGIWRTTTYDADTDFTDIGTQVDSTTIRPMLLRIMSQRTRGNRAPDLLLMSQEHFEAYDAATVSIQRIMRSGGLGDMGFTTLEYIGANRRAEIVLAGGIGSPMPANTTFGIETQSFRIRYNPARNFDKLFEGDGQKPINQDAIAQFIGWMGELTMVNPLFHFRFYDSDPNS
jgi:hypothetical protein